MLWLVVIDANDLSLNLRLVKPIMTAVRDIAEDVKFFAIMMGSVVLVVIWHLRCHQLIKRVKKG